MLKVVRKADIILFLLLIIAGLTTWLVPYLRSGASDQSEKYVYITVAGNEYGTYRLNKDNEITIEQDLNDTHTVNTVVISNDSVHMENSTCKNQVCVKTGVINRIGQSIVCLPNKVMVEIRNTAGDIGTEGFDAISK